MNAPRFQHIRRLDPKGSIVLDKDEYPVDGFTWYKFRRKLKPWECIFIRTKKGARLIHDFAHISFCTQKDDRIVSMDLYTVVSS